MPRSKIFPSFADAVGDIPDGSVIGFGGFAVVGMPINLYEALAKQNSGAHRNDLVFASANAYLAARLPDDANRVSTLLEQPLSVQR